MYKDFFEEINKLALRGMDFGSSRTRAILNALGSPDEKLKIFHIAGTNGKGSTAEYLTQILLADGKKTGAFTSPYVYNYFDQYKINGKNISSSKFYKYFKPALQASELFGATQFEVETAAAVAAFAGEGCEYAVIECGMGGRLDATNAVIGKQAALITSISLEHTKYLGDTLEEICAHKAGIIGGCRALVSALQPPQVKEYFKNTGVETVGEDLHILNEDKEGQNFSFRGREYRINMHGAAQAYNAALAVRAAEFAGCKPSAIKAGLENMRLGGRIEVIPCGNKTYILDGAHNPASFYPLTEYLKKFYPQAHLIYGCLSDKDIEGCIQVFKHRFQSVCAVVPESGRAMDKDKIISALKKEFNTVDYAASVSEALCAANGCVIAVCGSFTLLTEAKSWIEKRL